VRLASEASPFIRIAAFTGVTALRMVRVPIESAVGS
jgi:hypothetical protein